MCRAHVRTSKQRSKENWKAKRKGIETELLNVYDLSTKNLRSSPIAKSFGEVNLYTDITSGINSQHVEEKLSRLENEAAQVITGIQDACGQGTFVLTRRSLEVLRKFVFVMHYRKPNIQAQYFNVDPNNCMADWISRYMQTHNLKTPEDMWLHGLAYFLDTPHPEIVAKGEQIYAQYGEAALLQMMASKVDPKLENWFAVDYRSLANSHYFGVWEAAPGCEFIMGNNCFGLWEGLVMGMPDVQRIFIISPRLVLILRNNMTRRIAEGTLSAFVTSALADVATPSPITKYHGMAAFSSEEALMRYRTTPAAQKDTFTYTITKLTETQTREVNEVILLNVKKDGALVFKSKEYMLKAIRYHIASPDPVVQSENPYSKFSALLAALESTSNPSTESTVESDSDYRLRVVLEALRRRLVPFRSEWDACYWCYRAMTADPSQSHPLVVEMRVRFQQAKSVIGAVSKDKNRRSNPSARLVDSLSEEDSNCVLGRMSTLLKVLMGYERTRRLTNEAFVKESLMIGLIEWMVKERPDTIKDLVGSDTYRRLTLV